MINIQTTLNRMFLRIDKSEKCGKIRADKEYRVERLPRDQFKIGRTLTGDGLFYFYVKRKKHQ